MVVTEREISLGLIRSGCEDSGESFEATEQTENRRSGVKRSMRAELLVSTCAIPSLRGS